MARETKGSPAHEKKLEQYGVWVKVKPRDVAAAPVLEESFALSDLESPKPAGQASAGSEEGELTAEEEKLLDELETELEPGAESAFDDIEAPALSVPEEEPLLADSELPDIDTADGGESFDLRGSNDIELVAASEEELPELEEEREPAPRGSARSRGAAQTSEVEVTLSERIGEEDQFDDLAALESELASVTTKSRDPSAASAEILARIEDELRSIRNDLNKLRADLSGLRKTAAAGKTESPSAAAGKQGGFFDEDEDEAIALTGDVLDNILKTAEFTEESAETPGPAADMDLPGDPSGDILNYETPAPEAVETPVQETDLEILEQPVDDDTLVLSDDDLLPTDGLRTGSTRASEEDLPADLVLEELQVEEDTESAPSSRGSSELPEIDLEGIPEMEGEQAAAPGVEKLTDDAGSETIDLETLDLGEEPMVIDAIPEQVDDVEELPDAEEVLDEEIAPGATGQHDTADEVDLEALAAEAEDLEENVPTAPVVEDLEIGELESLSEDTAGERAPQKEIEISFEGDLAEEVESLGEDALPEAEEVTDSPGAAAAASSGIPDNLKDEIRTVLQYMDHLLEALPDEKIQEFAKSDYFVMYKKLFEDLGLGE